MARFALVRIRSDRPRGVRLAVGPSLSRPGRPAGIADRAAGGSLRRTQGRADRGQCGHGEPRALPGMVLPGSPARGRSLPGSARRLDRYFQHGAWEPMEVPAELAGTDFQHAVWKRIARIPRENAAPTARSRPRWADPGPLVASAKPPAPTRSPSSCRVTAWSAPVGALPATAEESAARNGCCGGKRSPEDP